LSTSTSLSTTFSSSSSLSYSYSDSSCAAAACATGKACCCGSWAPAGPAVATFSGVAAGTSGAAASTGAGAWYGSDVATSAGGKTPAAASLAGASSTGADCLAARSAAAGGGSARGFVASFAARLSASLAFAFVLRPSPSLGTGLGLGLGLRSGGARGVASLGFSTSSAERRLRSGAGFAWVVCPLAAAGGDAEEVRAAATSLGGGAALALAVVASGGPVRSSLATCLRLLPASALGDRSSGEGSRISTLRGGFLSCAFLEALDLFPAGRSASSATDLGRRLPPSSSLGGGSASGFGLRLGRRDCSEEGSRSSPARGGSPRGALPPFSIFLLGLLGLRRSPRRSSLTGPSRPARPLLGDFAGLRWTAVSFLFAGLGVLRPLAGAGLTSARPESLWLRSTDRRCLADLLRLRRRGGVRLRCGAAGLAAAG